MKKTTSTFGLKSIAVALAIGFASSANAAIKTDIIFVIDESGSMGGVQANLPPFSLAAVWMRAMASLAMVIQIKSRAC